MENYAQKDREEAWIRVKKAAKVLTYFGMPNFSEGWRGKDIGREGNNSEISIEEMNANELDKVYSLMAEMRDCVQNLMDEIDSLSTINRIGRL